MLMDQQIDDNFPVGMRVLAVDDNPTCLKLLETLLRKCQYHVTTTSQAITALKMLRENKDKFDLVISEVHMPDMDGFKLLELVGLELDLPVIMVSAYGDYKLVMKGITHGACDYLLKPVRIGELKNIWQHVLRRKKFDPNDKKNLCRPQGESCEVEGLNGTGDHHDQVDSRLNRKMKDQKYDDEDEEHDENEDSSSQKKPRVVWTLELHRKFVAAVNHLGLDKAVPRRILAMMNVEKLTRENVASHLQKYRLYLKRISSASSQQNNMMAAALGSSDSAYMRMASFNGFGDVQSHHLKPNSKAIEDAVEDGLRDSKRGTAPVEIEVNLSNGRCSELPENPSSLFLVKLFLQHNTYLTEVPVSFFDHMPVLQLLDLSNTSIKSLPSSISKLFRLRELFLRDCEMLMELPPEIGRLTNLKVFDLEGTKLVHLPKQVGWLLQLECLKFSLYKYSDCHKQIINGTERPIISKETISKLSSLKELSIDVDPMCEWWDEEVEGIITDLGKLGNMETLKLYLPTPELFQQLLECRCIKRHEWNVVMPLMYPTLSNFCFVVGRYEEPIMSCVPRYLQEEFVKLEKCIRHVNSEEYFETKVLEHVGALFLQRNWKIGALSEFDLTNTDNLEFCMLAECDSMRAILDVYHIKTIVDNRGKTSLLGSLRYLGIHYMKNLSFICKGPRRSFGGYMSNLKILAIYSCPKLTEIFNQWFLKDLIFLEELVVEDCPKVQSIVNYFYFKKGLLPSLKKISLLHLPELNSISGNQCIASRLEKMVIYNCPKLKTIHPLHICSKDVIEIKGESKWWKSNKSDWSSEMHDYLVRVFVPFKVDDDDDDDEDLTDEVAEAVRISLKSQVTEINKDLVINMGTEMEDKFEEYPKEIGTSNSTGDRNKGDINNMNMDMKDKFEAHPNKTGTTESTIETNEHLVVNMDMKMEDKLEMSPKEIGTSKSTSDEFGPMELCSSEFSTTNLKSMAVNKFYWCLVAEPRKYPEFGFASLASTLEVVSLAGYDLSDDSIPRNLSSLSSLWELDLSFTQISTLHKGIKWPNGLKFLKLNGCRNLRILSELPLLQVLAVNECRALERVCFGLNKLHSAPVSLLSHGCDRLLEVDFVFRVDPIESIDAKVTKSWGLDNLKFLANVEVELCNNMTRTRKKLPLKGLFEFGILSSFIPKIMIPNFFSNMQRSSCITFVVPSTTQTLNLLRGMNLCIVYECSKEHKQEQCNDFHIEVTNGKDNWTYYPTIYGDGEDDIMWLSYWDRRYYKMEAGDMMTVSVVVGSGYEVKECGTCLVYEGESQEIITPVTTCQSSETKKTHMNLSLPLSSISNVHSRSGHHLFLDPLKYLP